MPVEFYEIMDHGPLSSFARTGTLDALLAFGSEGLQRGTRAVRKKLLWEGGMSDAICGQMAGSKQSQSPRQNRFVKPGVNPDPNLLSFLGSGAQGRN